MFNWVHKSTQVVHVAQCLMLNEISAGLISSVFRNPSGDWCTPNEPRNVHLSTVITCPLPALIINGCIHKQPKSWIILCCIVIKFNIRWSGPETWNKCDFFQYVKQFLLRSMWIQNPRSCVQSSVNQDYNIEV